MQPTDDSMHIWAVKLHLFLMALHTLPYILAYIIWDVPPNPKQISLKAIISSGDIYSNN